MEVDRYLWKTPVALFEEAAQSETRDLCKAIEDPQSILDLACLVGGLTALRINEEFKTRSIRIDSGLPENSSVSSEAPKAVQARSERAGTSYSPVELLANNPLDLRLMLAAQERAERPAYALACMSLLLAHGADPNCLIYNGFGPLHFLVTRDDLEGVILLLNSGADVDFWTSYYDTPLTLAIKKRSERMVDLLLARGANFKDNDGDLKTPYDLALETGDPSIIKRISDALEKSGRA